MKNICLLILICSLNSLAQGHVNNFKKLSSPEKYWVIFHLFKAKKAMKISFNAIQISDSIYNQKILDGDKNGGQSDAFKHSYWMARLTQEIGKIAAFKLGIAHEKGNYKNYKKNKLEDGSLPDKISSDMDLFNNCIGIQFALKNDELPEQKLINDLIQEIKKGEMKIIKKDSAGNFLSCEGILIPKDALLNSRENDKCLISSNKNPN